MSHKIKILGEEQFSQLLSTGSDFGKEKVSLFVSSLLPGLFYSASDRILNSKESRYLYIPHENFPAEYSTGYYNNSHYKRFELAPLEIEVEESLFIPILAENRIIGGLFGKPGDIVKYDRSRLLKEYDLDEYFTHLSEMKSNYLKKKV